MAAVCLYYKYTRVILLYKADYLYMMGKIQKTLKIENNLNSYFAFRAENISEFWSGIPKCRLCGFDGSAEVHKSQHAFHFVLRLE